MQHSLWVVEVNSSNLQVVNTKSSDLISPRMSAKNFFRRIWQGKGSHDPASKVLMLCFIVDFWTKLLLGAVIIKTTFSV